MKKIILLLVLFSSFAAFADDLPPQPAPGTAPYTKEYLDGLWRRGNKTTPQILRGRWILILDLDESYSSTGVKNKDGSVETLDFQYRIVGKDDFANSQGQSVFTVVIQNSPNRHNSQGPFLVNAIEPQFAQWLYHNDQEELPEKMIEIGYLSHQCRLMPGSPQKLICKSTSHYGGYAEICSDVYYIGFLKVP